MAVKLGKKLPDSTGSFGPCQEPPKTFGVERYAGSLRTIRRRVTPDALFAGMQRCVWLTTPATLILTLLTLIAPRIIAQSALDHDFWQVAEGLTARTSKPKIEVAYRMFSAPTFQKVCAAAGKPSRLVVQTAPLTLTLGSWFPLNGLEVVAEDESGRLLPAVPLAIEVEDKSPPLLDLRPEMISDAKLMPVRAGRFQFRVRTFCPGSNVEATIPAVINKQ
jgi:hypothetical protein